MPSANNDKIWDTIYYSTFTDSSSRFFHPRDAFDFFMDWLRDSVGIAAVEYNMCRNSYNFGNNFYDKCERLRNVFDGYKFVFWYKSDCNKLKETLCTFTQEDKNNLRLYILHGINNINNGD